MDSNQHTRLAVAFIVLCASACATQGGGNNNQTDAWGPRTDANPDCSVSPTLTIGTCQKQGTATPCAGVPDEVVEFVTVENGSTIKMVVGPQGSTMFVLGIQTSGIDPGDPMDVVSADNPSVTITLVHEEGSEMALYRGRTAFATVAGQESMLEANGLFVIVDGRLSELVGAAITAHATVIDKNDEQRCGVLSFIAAQ